MSSIAGLFTAIEAHLTAAGAAQTPPIVQLIPGEPQGVSNSPVLTYWIPEGGLSIWESNTLSQAQYKLAIHWEAWFPGSQRTAETDRTLELRLASIAFSILSEFYGDVTMGGEATGVGLEISDPIFGWTQVGAVICRSVGGDIRFYLANVAPILP